MTAVNPFRPGDRVFIPLTVKLVTPNNIEARDRGYIGAVTRIGDWGDVSVKWPNGHTTSLHYNFLARAPKEPEMAAISTARVNIKLNFEHESTAEQIEQFRDRLIYAGFTKKQANKIATKAFTLAEIKEATT